MSSLMDAIRQIGYSQPIGVAPSTDQIARTLPVPLPTPTPLPQDSPQDAYTTPLVTVSEPTPVPANAPYASYIKDWDALVDYYGGGDPLTGSRSKGGEVDARLLAQAFGLPGVRGVNLPPDQAEAIRYYRISTSGSLGKFIDATVEYGPYVAGAVIIGGGYYGLASGGGLFPTAGGAAEVATGAEAVTAAQAVAPVTAAEETYAGVSLSGDFLLSAPTTFSPSMLESGAVAGAAADTGLGFYSGLASIGSSIYSTAKKIFSGTAEAGISKITESVEKEINSFFGGGGAVGGGESGSGTVQAGFLDSLKAKGMLIPILGAVATLVFYFAYSRRKRK